MKIKSDGPMGCRMIDTASQFSTKFNQINSNVTREDRIEILNNVIIEWSYLSGQVVDNNSFYDYFTPNWDYFYDLKEISPVEWINRKSLDRIYDFYVKDYKPNQYEWTKHLFNPSKKINKYLEELYEVNTDFENSVVCYHRGWHNHGQPVWGGIHPLVYAQFVNKISKDGLVLLCTDNGYWETKFLGHFNGNKRFRSLSRQLMDENHSSDSGQFPSDEVAVMGVFADYYNTILTDGHMKWMAKIIYMSKFKNLITNAHTQTTIQLLFLRENMDNLVVIDSELKHNWIHTIDDVDTSDIIDTMDWGTSERAGFVKLPYEQLSKSRFFGE